MIIVNARVLGSSGARASGVEITGDRITALLHQVPAHRADVLDGEGRYLMPGLVNAHDHLSLKGLLLDRDGTNYYDIYRRAAEEQVLHCAHAALVSLGEGVTTVRDAGAAFFTSTLLRDAVRAGLLPGPDVRTCGQVLSVPFVGDDVKAPGMTVDAAGIEGIREVVGRLAARRVDYIKLKGHRRDFADAERTEFFSAEEIAFAGQEAHRLGLRFAVHAWHNHIVEAALRARVADSVEHGNLLAERPDLLAQMREQGVLYVPNLVSWAPSPSPRAVSNDRAGIPLEQIWETVRLAIGAGVRLAAGTDLYTEHLRAEVAAYRDLGMTIEDALSAVTTNGAELVGAEDEIGRIEPGYRADLILLDADPRDDLAAMSTPHTVVLRGKAFDGAQLRALAGASAIGTPGSQQGATDGAATPVHNPSQAAVMSGPRKERHS